MTKPIAETEELRQELDRLSEKFPALSESLSSLQHQVRTHEWYFGLVRPTCYAAVAIVTAASALLGWMGIPAFRDSIMSAVKTEIGKTVDSQIDQANKVVDERLKDLHGKVCKATDRLIYSNADFLAVIDEVKNGHRPPIALFQLPKEEIRSDGLFALYTDALVRFGEYDGAYEFLSELKKEGKFPSDRFSWPQSYANAGFIEWLNAISTDPPPKLQIQQARKWLEEAERLARKRIAAADNRRPAELLVLLFLTQNRMKEAIHYARQVKNFGGTRNDLHNYLKTPWFQERLKKQQPEIELRMEQVLSKVFGGENVKESGPQSLLRQ